MHEQNLPNHIAIIPDGNRRWAKIQGVITSQGHAAGIEQFKVISRLAFDKGVKHLTFWAMSIDNFKKRDALEINFLIAALKRELGSQTLIADFVKDGVRVKVLGMWEQLIKDPGLHKAIRNLEDQTATGTKANLTILFGYDGKTEMLQAVSKLNGLEINEDKLRENLMTGGLPNVDVVIRTGGQPHWLGGFLMWLAADSELYFTEKLWPEFDQAEFERALDDFSNRRRKFGS